MEKKFDIKNQENELQSEKSKKEKKVNIQSEEFDVNMDEQNQAITIRHS